MGRRDIIAAETFNERLEFDKDTGRIVSFKSKHAQDQEFITMNDSPCFVIQYLDGLKEFRQLDSTSAEATNFEKEETDGNTVLSWEFKSLGNMQIDALVSIKTCSKEEFSYWSIEVKNNSGIMVTDVQFPFIVVSYNLDGTPGTEALLRPFSAGDLIKSPEPQNLEPDSPHAWQFRPENGDAAHYPGMTFAQFLAYYNDRAGIYVSCQDANGYIKLIKPVHSGKGIRLGIAHVGDWPANGERKLEYDIVLGSFKGNWQDAADLYRKWSYRQEWANNPLWKRKDVPEWLLDSPPHIILRMQGRLDEGPTERNEEFLPYKKTIPLLETISEKVDSRLNPIVMSWERVGPWVYPDCFPPVGGEEALKEFTEIARERGWHVGSYCNGTRWVTAHYWSGYDGQRYFEENGGENCVCRTKDQEMWKENWDILWRPSYPCCIHVEKTLEIAYNFIEKLMDMGIDWIQFFDQNNGACSFPCYSESHGHAPVPARWMTDGMKKMHEHIREMLAEGKKKNGGRREFVLSVENPPNEYFMPFFQICDTRVKPEGHATNVYFKNFVPLFHYLYHEFILMHGGFGLGPEPYNQQIKNAYNLVVGEIPGAVMTGDGKLLNRDTEHWAPWEPPVGNNGDSLEMIRTGNALRRGHGRDFLVFGRMTHHANVSGIKTINWQENGKIHNIPAVFHAAWISPEGKYGVVLSNWTNESQQINIKDSRFGKHVLVHISSDNIRCNEYELKENTLLLKIPRLSCVLVETE